MPFRAPPAAFHLVPARTRTTRGDAPTNPTCRAKPWQQGGDRITAALGGQNHCCTTGSREQGWTLARAGANLVWLAGKLEPWTGACEGARLSWRRREIELTRPRMRDPPRRRSPERCIRLPSLVPSHITCRPPRIRLIFAV